MDLTTFSQPSEFMEKKFAGLCLTNVRSAGFVRVARRSHLHFLPNKHSFGRESKRWRAKRQA